MFGIEDDDASGREKCYTTVAQLPHFIDPKQPPITKPPFSAITGHPFVHTVEVTMPKEVYSSIESSLNSRLQKLRYTYLSMTLSSLIEGDFFNTYIKTGNILMISEGRSGLDNVFTLRDGVLKLELSKEDYERTGMTGKPVRTGGKKHAKERFIVELNLRLPSMLHGKRGFQRLEWAFKNVLNKPVTWLFFDLGTELTDVAEDDLSLKGNSPDTIPCEPVCTTHKNVTTPSFSDIQITNSTTELDLKVVSGEVSEWLAMVSLGSRRVSADDNIDPYLCRYDAPEIGDTRAFDIVSLKWHGFVPPNWIMHLFITLFRETAPRVCKSPSWFALSASALGRDAVEGKDGYTIMALPAAKDVRQFICWEFVGASIL
ncbi:ribonuclease P 40kDa subunit-domain-containing protein [Aspergillus aurantiobrunneus]